MNIKAKKVISACVTAGAFIGLAGISTAAEAGSWWGGAPTPFSVTCQSDSLELMRVVEPDLTGPSA